MRIFKNGDCKAFGRLEYISYLRIFATICVVKRHMCSTLIDNEEIFSITRRELMCFPIFKKHQLDAKGSWI